MVHKIIIHVFIYWGILIFIFPSCIQSDIPLDQVSTTVPFAVSPENDQKTDAEQPVFTWVMKKKCSKAVSESTKDKCKGKEWVVVNEKYQKIQILLSQTSHFNEALQSGIKENIKSGSNSYQIQTKLTDGAWYYWLGYHDKVDGSKTVFVQRDPVSFVKGDLDSPKIYNAILLKDMEPSYTDTNNNEIPNSIIAMNETVDTNSTVIRNLAGLKIQDSFLVKEIAGAKSYTLEMVYWVNTGRVEYSETKIPSDIQTCTLMTGSGDKATINALRFLLPQALNNGSGMIHIMVQGDQKSYSSYYGLTVIADEKQGIQDNKDLKYHFKQYSDDTTGELHKPAQSFFSMLPKNITTASGGCPSEAGELIEVGCPVSFNVPEIVDENGEEVDLTNLPDDYYLNAVLYDTEDEQYVCKTSIDENSNSFTCDNGITLNTTYAGIYFLRFSLNRKINENLVIQSLPVIYTVAVSPRTEMREYGKYTVVYQYWNLKDKDTFFSGTLKINDMNMIKYESNTAVEIPRMNGTFIEENGKSFLNAWSGDSGSKKGDWRLFGLPNKVVFANDNHFWMPQNETLKVKVKNNILKMQGRFVSDVIGNMIGLEDGSSANPVHYIGNTSISSKPMDFEIDPETNNLTFLLDTQDGDYYFADNANLFGAGYSLSPNLAIFRFGTNELRVYFKEATTGAGLEIVPFVIEDDTVYPDIL